MLTGIELMLGIEQFGRWNIQEFVVRSQDTKDVLAYLRAERVLEMVKVMPFVTVDLVSFEKRTSLPSISDEIWGKSQHGEQHSKSVAPPIQEFI
jgi:hypothetical protein